MRSGLIVTRAPGFVSAVPLFSIRIFVRLDRVIIAFVMASREAS